MKRAILGFKGVHLAPITQNTAEAYITGPAFHLPYAGKMTRSVKESSDDIYYDDALYATVSENLGEDVEITFGEMSKADLIKLGVGADKGGVLEADLDMAPKDYSLRVVTNTVSKLPRYFKWRKVTINSVRFGDFQTKANGTQVCEVIMKGSIGKPAKADVKAWAMAELDETSSNQDACNTFLSDAETLEA